MAASAPAAAEAVEILAQIRNLYFGTAAAYSVLLIGLVLIMATGALIFTGGAQAYYEGYWFRLKMVLLATTLIFHFTSTGW